MFTDGCNEIINRNSRYEQLLRGDIGGEDIKLIFVDNSSADDNQKSGGGGGSKPNTRRSSDAKKKQHEKRREIMAHKAFLHSCGFISAVFVENRFAEGESGECVINVPQGTFGAVDALMRWCYDSKCQFDIVDSMKTSFLVMEQYVAGIPALWVLADFLQCRELCDAIIEKLKCGQVLQTGKSFAVLVEEVQQLGMPGDLLGAAIGGLNLKPIAEYKRYDSMEEREKIQREKLESMLDCGGDEMLNALAKCHHLIERRAHSTEGESNGSAGEDYIVHTLGQYLAEMKRDDRAKMLPSLFASCLANFPPGTVPEANYATIVMDYIADRGECENSLSESCVMTLLGTIDFGVISRDALVHDFIPKVEKLVPSYALMLNDFTLATAPIATRCSFSMITLRPLDEYDTHHKAVVLSCGDILSYWSFQLLKKKEYPPFHHRPGEKVVRCPFCVKRCNWRQHWLSEHRDVYSEFYLQHNYDARTMKSSYSEPEEMTEFQFQEIESSRSFFDRKSTKSEALMRWVVSQGDTEDENATSERRNKRSRSDNSSLLQSNGLFVRVLNQCSEMESEGVFFHSIRSTKCRVKDTMDAFAEKMTTMPVEAIGFFRYDPNGFSLGEKLQPQMRWKQVGFNLRGVGEELLIARRLQTAGKPVIRIYSDIGLANMEITIDLKDWVDVLTYPRGVVENEEVKNTTLSWIVNVFPREAAGDHSSILQHKSTDGALREYSYLFWEAATMEPFRICLKNASCVRSSVLSDGLLQDALLAQGLSTDEATEMATHWLPALTKKEFALIEFLPSEELDKRATLNVVPMPALIHRVFMLFRSADTEHSCNLPLVRSPALALPRGAKKPVIVEWGGMECF